MGHLWMRIHVSYKSIWMETTNVYLLCPHNGKCVLKECPNFKMCGAKIPHDVLNCFNGRCFECDLQFGCNLSIRETSDEEYAICLNDKQTFIKFPHCIHETCVNCFKTIHQINNGPVITLQHDEESLDDDVLLAIEYFITVSSSHGVPFEQFEHNLLDQLNFPYLLSEKHRRVQLHIF